MEDDSIVWIKEEVPSDIGLTSQLPTTVASIADSSFTQVYIFFLEIICVVIEIKLWIVLFSKIQFA